MDCYNVHEQLLIAVYIYIMLYQCLKKQDGWCFWQSFHFFGFAHKGDCNNKLVAHVLQLLLDLQDGLPWHDYASLFWLPFSHFVHLYILIDVAWFSLILFFLDLLFILMYCGNEVFGIVFVHVEVQITFQESWHSCFHGPWLWSYVYLYTSFIFLKQ